MDMADLAADPLFTGPDLFIQDNAAADAGSQSYHDKVFVAFSASLPHLAKGSYIGIISAPDRNSIQHGTEFLLGIYIPPAQIHADLHIAIRHDRSRNTKSCSQNVRKVNFLFHKDFPDGSCHIL